MPRINLHPRLLNVAYRLTRFALPRLKYPYPRLFAIFPPPSSSSSLLAWHLEYFFFFLRFDRDEMRREMGAISISFSQDSNDFFESF